MIPHDPAATRGAAIDLRSDFLARRTPAMDEAAARAAAEPFRFGLREDPNQRALERRIASLLGHQDALVFPTCTMANLTAMLLVARPGTRAVIVPDAHVATSEAGGAAAFAGLLLDPVAVAGAQCDDRGASTLALEAVEASSSAAPGDAASRRRSPWMPSPADWRRAIGPTGDAQKPAPSVLVLENTHNRAGGLPLDVEYSSALVALARERGLRIHLDGSRLLNAATALDVAPWALAAGFDTVSLSLNKGLGSPIAAALAGAAETIERALTVRQRLGGGIRPTGRAAAAALAALDEPWPFAEAHRLARRLARGLALIAGLSVDVDSVGTNIVVAEVGETCGSVEALLGRMAALGLLALPFGPRRIRFVTYRGVSEPDVDAAVAIVRRAMPEAARREPPPGHS